MAVFILNLALNIHRQGAGVPHVKITIGRDYHDSTPTRGVFKGTHTEKLSVAVVMQRV